MPNIFETMHFCHGDDVITMWWRHIAFSCSWLMWHLVKKRQFIVSSKWKKKTFLFPRELRSIVQPHPPSTPKAKPNSPVEKQIFSYFLFKYVHLFLLEKWNIPPAQPQIRHLSCVCLVGKDSFIGWAIGKHGGLRTVVQNHQEFKRKYWATFLSICLFACTAHSFTRSILLTLLARSAASTPLLTRSLIYSRTRGKMND